MASYHRIMTVDPLWTVSRLVRSAMDLMDRPVVQVDVTGGHQALDELARGGKGVLVTALHMTRQRSGFELALPARQVWPEAAVIILADENDPEDLDEETRAESPFAYLRRPVDPHQF